MGVYGRTMLEKIFDMLFDAFLFVLGIPFIAVLHLYGICLDFFEERKVRKGKRKRK